MPLRTTVSLLFLAFLLLAGPVASAQDKGALMQVNKATKIRKERSTASAVLDGLAPGQRVKAGFPADNWLAVFPPDSPANDESQRLGYVFAPLLTPVAAAAAEVPPAKDQAAPAAAKPASGSDPARTPSQLMQVNRVARIRSERNTAAPALRRLDPGQQIKAGFPADNWLAVFPPDSPANDESQRLGYVFAPLLTPVAAAAAEAPPAKDQAAPAAAKPAAPPVAEPAAPAAAKPAAPPVAEPVAPAAAKPAAREPGAPMQAKSVAKIRSERNTASPALGRLEPGQRVKAGFPADNWLAVFPPDSPANDESQRLGYVFAPLLTAAIVAPPVQAAPAAAKTGPGPEAPRSQATSSGAYTVLEKLSVERPAGPWIEFKVMLKAETLPSPDDLKTLAATIRSGMAGASPRVAVHVYLPGMDLQGLSYAIARFEPEGLAEFWTRDTALYGTPWAKYIR